MTRRTERNGPRTFPVLTALRKISCGCAPQTSIAAGGKRSFEVAAIKPDNGAFKPSAFPLDNGDAYKPVGGRFFADFPLLTYIQFAYKTRFTPEQRESVLAHLPRTGSPPRDSTSRRAPMAVQPKIMMQSLLADRFQLAIHFDSRETAVLALTLSSPPRPDPSSVRMPKALLATHPPLASFPLVCDAEARIGRPDHSFMGGSRNITGLAGNGSFLARTSGSSRDQSNRPHGQVGLHPRVEPGTDRRRAQPSRPT